MKRLIACLLCLFLCGCTAQELQDPGIFYYPRAQTAYRGDDGVFAREERELKGIRGDMDTLLQRYCAGPVTDGLKNPLPPDTTLLGWSLEEDTLTLRFSTGFSQLSGIDLTIAAGCLARTFLPMTGAGRLTITANGALLDGQTTFSVSGSDLSLQDNSLDRLLQELTVYYTTAERRYLIGHEVRLDPAAEESVAYQLLELLLTPPESSDLRSALPAGTQIRSVTIKDGLCTVALNPAFENRRFYSQSGQLLSLMCMVNTLTALPQIDRVEFLVGGDLLIRYGALSVPEPLVRDERCIGPVRTGLGEQDTTVYLVNGSEGRLLSLPVRLPQSGTMSPAERVMRYLLSDSGTNGIRSCISAGTVLNSITVTDGVCRVDLSREYLNSPGDLALSTRVIAANLCSLEGISQVVILVDGNIPEGYDSTFFGLIYPNSDWFL